MRTRPYLGLWDWIRAPHRGFAVDWRHYPEATTPGAIGGWQACVTMHFRPRPGAHRRRDGLMFSPDKFGGTEPMGWRREMARVLVRMRKRLRYREAL